MEIFNIALYITAFILLFIVTHHKFNQPPTQRSGTTWKLFHFGLVLYYLLSIMIWALVVGFLQGGVPLFGNLSTDFSGSYQTAIPIVALLIVILSHLVKTVQKFDIGARKLCSRMAAIPSEKDRLVIELREHAKYEIEKDELRDEIQSVAVNLGISRDSLDFSGMTLPQGLFTRTLTLYYIIFCCNKRRKVENTILTKNYRRFLSSPIYQKHLLEAKEKFQSFLPFAKDYLGIGNPTPELNQNFIQKNDEVFNALSDIVARAVLCVEKSYSGIYSKLRTIGFWIDTRFRPLNINQYVGILIGVIFIYCILFIVFTNADPTDRFADFDRDLFQALIIGFDVIMSIIVAVIAAQVLSQKLEDDSGTPPIATFALASLISFFLSFFIRFIFRYLQVIPDEGLTNPAMKEAIEVVINNWPKRLFPAFMTFSLAFACWHSIRSETGSLLTIAKTCIIVTTGLGIALTVVCMLAHAGECEQIGLGAGIFMLSTVGIGVGAFVPFLYRKSYRFYLQQSTIT